MEEAENPSCMCPIHDQSGTAIGLPPQTDPPVNHPNGAAYMAYMWSVWVLYRIEYVLLFNQLTRRVLLEILYTN